MKRKTILFCCATTALLFLIHTDLLSQSYRSSKQVNSIDFVLGGDYGFRILKNDASPSGKFTLQDNDRYKFNYKAGLNFNLGVGRQTILKLGLRFSNPGFRIIDSGKLNFEETSPTSVLSENDMRYSYTFEYHLYSLPVGFRYHFINKPCSPYIELGVSPSYYLQSIIRETDDLNVETEIVLEQKEIDKFQLFSFVSFGGNFAIAKKVDGFTQIVANYQLNNLNDEIIKEKILGIGIELGTRIYL